MIYALVDYLAMFYQSGNLVQVEVIARSMLSSIPEDLVALQFLGLALYQMGRVDEARRMFSRAAAKLTSKEKSSSDDTCELAEDASLRAATRRNSGLAEGWHRISQILSKLNFEVPAARALEASVASDGAISTVSVR